MVAATISVAGFSLNENYLWTENVHTARVFDDISILEKDQLE